MNTDQASRQYQRIKKAIEYLLEVAPQQPRLEEVAAHVHLSPFQFQREFSSGVGLSPNQFSRVLTREFLRCRLAGQKSLQEIANDAAMSSVSRLHDLCVTLEAMTPQQIRQGGKGVLLHYGFGDTPFGQAIVGTTARGICHLRFSDDRLVACDELQKEWPQAELVHEDPTATELLARIFRSPSVENNQPIRLWLRGTNFQVQVWRALLAIPHGELRSYGQVALSIGRPKAARAVGTAIGSNPVAWLVPCHRVIQSSGALGGYRWGLTRKAAMVAGECVLA